MTTAPSAVSQVTGAKLLYLCIVLLWPTIRAGRKNRAGTSWRCMFGSYKGNGGSGNSDHRMDTGKRYRSATLLIVLHTGYFFKW